MKRDETVGINVRENFQPEFPSLGPSRRSVWGFCSDDRGMFPQN